MKMIWCLFLKDGWVGAKFSTTQQWFLVYFAEYTLLPHFSWYSTVKKDKTTKSSYRKSSSNILLVCKHLKSVNFHNARQRTLALKFPKHENRLCWCWRSKINVKKWVMGLAVPSAKREKTRRMHKSLSRHSQCLVDAHMLVLPPGKRVRTLRG